MSFKDVKGYYGLLGAAPEASVDEIKSAYRDRVKETHPDSGGGGDTDAFRRITEAYNVLGDAEARAAYDTVCRDLGRIDADSEPSRSARPRQGRRARRRTRPEPRPRAEPKPEPEPEVEPTGPEPVPCSVCGTISAQPRYVVITRVIGLVLRSSTRRIEGVFCRACADRAAIKASLATWLLGWWSLPRGPVEAARALLRNLASGQKPADRNAELLAGQARAFAARGQKDLASDLAIQANRFRRDPGLDGLIAGGGKRRLKDRWRIGGLAFVIQALPIGLVVAWLIIQGGALAIGLVRDQAAGLFADRGAPPPAAETGARTPAPEAGPSETRFVIEDRTTVHAAPRADVQIVDRLAQFDSVTVVGGETDNGYLPIITPGGMTGFVAAAALTSGANARRDWCAENAGPRPETGDVFAARGTGSHSLGLVNPRRGDALVKLRDRDGRTALSVFVRGGTRITLQNIADGVYKVEFAIGTNYSRACDRFLDGMLAFGLPEPIRFETTNADDYILRALALILPTDDQSGANLIPRDTDRFVAD
ncbi:MAG: DnaJ domain-containing protein [Alphaproteobacteria bacterium]|jgi:hypothetical protein|nr:DnaJ domain-containing protein [Alphaproteobacteria bacterium]MDP6516030.1 DnaJ domain-containing protein [Alphaproteobacteria bacterium]